MRTPSNVGSTCRAVMRDYTMLLDKRGLASPSSCSPHTDLA